MSQIAKRYTNAMIASATAEDLANLTEIFEALSASLSDAKAASIFNSPYISKAEQESILLEAVSGAKSDKLNNLIKLLVEKNRVSAISDIAKAFKSAKENVDNSFKGTIEGVVTFDEATQKSFAEGFSKKVDANVAFETKNSDYDGVKINVDSLGLEVGFSKTVIKDQMIDHILKSI